tara:strand:+ start:6787 stop:7602 length:816 start_codon:yes stop_codon:yes gene_type:complete
MSQGVLLFAHNSPQIDYVKQAVYCAKKIKQHLDLQVALVTDSKAYLERAFPYYSNYIDVVIGNHHKTDQHRKFWNGSSYKTLPWNNFTRCYSYDLTPFDRTLVLDTDFLVGNNLLLKCFSNNDFKISKKFIDLNPSRNDITLSRVSDTSIDMYWATVFYFCKNKFSKTFFDLVQHIQDNWNYYRLCYQIQENNFRNDFAFSIALHLMGNPQKELPCSIFLTTDKDLLIEIEDDRYKILLDNETVCSVNKTNVHVMNKFTLNENIHKELQNE